MLRRLLNPSRREQPAGAISALIAREGATRPSGESLLDRLERDRHERIAGMGGSTLLPPMPPGFRYEDVMGDGAAEGFVPLPEAARRMETSEARIVELVRLGALEAYGRRVRPAIVNVMGAT